MSWSQRPAPPVVPAAGIAPMQTLQADVVEKAKKAADLQARIAEQFRNSGLQQVAAPTAPPEDTQ